MVAKKLHKHPWESGLSQPVHVNKVLVHEEVCVFHYDDIDGNDVIFALDIRIRGTAKVLWNEKVYTFLELSGIFGVCFPFFLGPWGGEGCS